MNLTLHILIVGMVLLSGCASDLDLNALTKQPLKVTSFSEAREASERHIACPSSEQETLAAWFEAHRTGWKRSYDTYAPGVLKVSGTNFTLDVWTTRVILNVSGHPQYVRDASVSEFTFLSP